MTLMKCPECANEISSHARTCPRCGYPLSLDKGVKTQEMNPEKSMHQYDVLPTSTKSVELESKVSNKGSRGLIIAGVVLIIAVVLVMVFLVVAFISHKLDGSNLAGNIYSYEPSRYQTYLVEFGKNVLILSDNHYKDDFSSISGVSKDSLRSSKKSYEYSKDSKNQITCNGKTYTYEINSSNGSITFNSQFLDLAKSWDIWSKGRFLDVGPKETIEEDEPFIKGDESYEDLKLTIEILSAMTQGADSRIQVEVQVDMINEIVNEIHTRFPKHKSDVKYRTVSDFWP